MKGLHFCATVEIIIEISRNVWVGMEIALL
jgi:hypothetical protein